jgi:hypothetical protein
MSIMMTKARKGEAENLLCTPLLRYVPIYLPENPYEGTTVEIG